jgi:hypothetical protein
MEQADDILREMKANAQMVNTISGSSRASSAAKAISFVVLSLCIGNSHLTQNEGVLSLADGTPVRVQCRCCQLDHYRQAGSFYIASASLYPEDDENHACKSTACLISLHMTISLLSPEASNFFSKVEPRCVSLYRSSSAYDSPFQR